MELTEHERAARRRLSAFNRGTRQVRERFWAKLRAEIELEHARAQRLEAEGAPPPRGYPAGLPIWDSLWQRRADREWARLERPVAEGNNFEAERDRLLEIEPAEYVERLTGELVPERSRKIPCPLPSHDERTASFHVYPSADRGWRCFGCSRGGRIYDLAGALWGLELRGAQFSEIHHRLVELFG